MKHFTNNKLKTLTIIFCVAFLLRLIYGFWAFKHEGGTHGFVDDWAYITYAKAILDPNYSVWAPNPADLSKMWTTVGWGWPFILAVLFFIFGEVYWPVFILNALFTSLIIFIIYKLAELCFNSKTAFLASIWAIFYIHFFQYTGTVLKENFLIFLVLTTTYIFLLFINTNKLKWLISFSILFAYLIHSDERYFIFAPIFVVSFFVFLKDWNNALKMNLIFGVTLVLLMLPWAIRNYKVYQRPVLLTIRTASITDKIFGFDNDKNPKPIDVYTRENLDHFEMIVEKIKSGELSPNDSIVPVYIRNAIVQYKIYPKTQSRSEALFWEAIEFWRPFRFKTGFVANGYRVEPLWSMKHNFSTGISYGILLPLFIAGIFISFYKKHKTALFLISLIILQFLVHILFYHVRDRYRFPVDSLIIIISFYALVEIALFIKKLPLHKKYKNQ